MSAPAGKKWTNVFVFSHASAVTAEYNKYCEDGEAPQFFKNEASLVHLKEDPFSIAEFQPGSRITLSCLKNNGGCRAVGRRRRCRPVEHALFPGRFRSRLVCCLRFCYRRNSCRSGTFIRKKREKSYPRKSRVTIF